MAKSKDQINKEAVNSDVDSPAVIAYRLGQVENAVREGFAAHDKKLDAITSNFVTKEEFEARVRPLEASKARDWVWKTASAIVGGSLVGLIIYAVTK